MHQCNAAVSCVVRCCLSLLCAGYPFDIVASPKSSSSSKEGTSSSSGGWWGRLLAYAAASYHLPLLIGFSVANRGEFVWGGAMVLRAAELRKAAAEDAAAAAAAAAAGGGGKALAGGKSDSAPNILQVGVSVVVTEAADSKYFVEEGPW
jgi:hypothetical protein